MSTYEPPASPADLRDAGRALWEAVTGRFELDPHELITLAAAGRSADLAALADDLLDAEGLVVETERGGTKPHPAEAIARQNRQQMGRLMAALRLPVVTGDPASDHDDSEGVVVSWPQQRGGHRGHYAKDGW